MPDPKLELVRDEIKAILRKHDVAGAVAVVSPTHAIYSLNLDTSWTCSKSTPESVHFSTQHLPEKDKEPMVRSTVMAVMGLEGSLADLLQNVQHCQQMLGQHFTISHIMRAEKPGGRGGFHGR